MSYLISFLEGIITFISPCLLPMLPIYISYFTGQDSDGNNKKPIMNSVGFVIGFTFIFILLGAFAGTAGSFLKDHTTVLNIISGSIIVIFGLNFIGLIKIPLLNSNHHFKTEKFKPGFLSSILFGLTFSIGWTPCVGAFLGSALMLAASSGESLKGIFMLLSFSLGLGIPFIASAVLIDKLKTTFNFIKKHYQIINLISGAILVAIGIMMATGLMGSFLSLLTF